MFTELHLENLNQTPQYDLSVGLMSRLKVADTFQERVEILEEAEEVFDQLDVRDHAIRVADVSRDLSLHCGFDTEYSERLHFATRLHDVGKLFMPMAILEKDGRPTDDEYSIIKEHASHGGELLGEDAPEFIVNVARYHHERYDGLGYNKIVGEDIPVEARLVQVADVYDALRSERSYKAGMSEENTLNKMVAMQKSGVMFDPYFFRKFVEMRLSLDENNDISASSREALSNFSKSNPMSDINSFESSEIFNGWKISSNGNRGRFELNEKIDYEVLVEKKNSIGVKIPTIAGSLMKEVVPTAGGHEQPRF